jgi:hypothetical protein
VGRALSLCLAAIAVSTAGCATDRVATEAERERLDSEYRTGSNFPKRQERGVDTYSKEAVIREQQVGAPGPAPRPFGGGS